MAAAWGLVNRAVPDDELVAATDELLAAATRGSAASKADGKRTLYAQLGLTQPAAYELAIDAMAAAVRTPAAQASFDTFLNRRH
jgi:enoyl-CoA hydratase/carnithine racemase